MIPEKELPKHLDYKATDDYWNQLESITVTPISTRGLGEHFTFEFVAPCYETVKEGTVERQEESFYGGIKFDYKQFGSGDTRLSKENPIHYCLKLCHKIGYYFQ